jgi:hypothetical protein
LQDKPNIEPALLAGPIDDLKLLAEQEVIKSIVVLLQLGLQHLLEVSHDTPASVRLLLVGDACREVNTALQRLNQS